MTFPRYGPDPGVLPSPVGPCSQWSGRVSSGAMSEIVFVVEQAPGGGFTARAVGESIFTEADSLAQLHERAREAVRCHFDDGEAPKLIRLRSAGSRKIGL